ncbi:MAG: acetate kinase [Verrucomicrobiota bacterium]
MPTTIHQPTLLVINAGSSSLKFAVIDILAEKEIFGGLVEQVGSIDCRASWDGESQSGEEALPDSDLTGALQWLIERLPKDIEVAAVGHRVVHGGERFSSSALINEEVEQEISHCAPLAPLHNPANLEGIEAAREVFADVPHVAVFDTAFHQTLPPAAYRYAVPRAWYDELDVRRYGFHGTSHRFVAEEAAKKLGQPLADLQLITAHLGNGCSACAINRGVSVDTTMGLTPLEGLVMGTRSGDIDPAIFGYLAKERGWSLERILASLNKESGLLGLSGISNDMRSLIEAAEGGDENADLAIEVFCHRLARLIGGLLASLTKLDALVFTGGIGEHASQIRERTLNRLGVFGLRLDLQSNQEPDLTEGNIATSDSIPCLVIPTNEELMIARETYSLIESNAPAHS